MRRAEDDCVTKDIKIKTLSDYSTIIDIEDFTIIKIVYA